MNFVWFSLSFVFFSCCCCWWTILFQQKFAFDQHHDWNEFFFLFAPEPLTYTQRETHSIHAQYMNTKIETFYLQWNKKKNRIYAKWKLVCSKKKKKTKWNNPFILAMVKVVVRYLYKNKLCEFFFLLLCVCVWFLFVCHCLSLLFLLFVYNCVYGPSIVYDNFSFIFDNDKQS